MRLFKSAIIFSFVFPVTKNGAPFTILLRASALVPY